MAARRGAARGKDKLEMPLGEGEPKPEALLKEGTRKHEAPRPKDRQKAGSPDRRRVSPTGCCEKCQGRTPYPVGGSKLSDARREATWGRFHQSNESWPRRTS